MGDERAFYVHPLELAFVKMKSAVPLAYDDEVKTFDTKISTPTKALTAIPIPQALSSIPDRSLASINNTFDDYVAAPDGIKLELSNQEGFFCTLLIRMKYLTY